MKSKSNSQSVSDFRRNRKYNLVRVCGQKCNLCGYDKCIAALEFHHIDPTQKEYGIGSSDTCRNIHKDIAEVKKCILVCANCHREIHQNMYTQPELWGKQVIDEAVIQELTYVKKEHLFCKECQKPISSSAITGLCADCIHIHQRVCERPSREELKVMIRTLPFTQIGKKYGVADNTIKKWCKAYGLPHLKRDIALIEDWSKI